MRKNHKIQLAAIAGLMLPLSALATVNPVAIPGSVTFAANGMPILNSNTGAAGAAFIDFDGGNWPSGGGAFAGYDLDGNATTFNAQEAKDIYNCWLDVSTHFAMFDLNVTTIAPNKSTTPTAHVLVTPGMSGGAANVGVYGSTSSNAGGANNDADARSRTTGITHELGHIMGLYHQSSYDANGNLTAQYRGTDGFNRAPIMGIDYAGKFSHWAKDTNSISSTTIQDDMQVISNNIISKAIQFNGSYSGDGYRVDDFGNTRPTAKALTYTTSTPSGSNVSLSFSTQGIIERYTDTDMFSFNWAGSPSGQSVTFNAEAVKNVAGSPVYASSLGMTLSIYNSVGTLIGQNTMSDVADVQANLTLSNLTTAGVYYVGITSFGGYEDLGAYTLSFSGLAANNGNIYWDNNGSTAGFGSAAGTWAAPTTGNASQGWGTAIDGSVTPASYTTTSVDTVAFGTSTLGLAAGTVAVSGTVTAGGIVFGSASGAITLSGGTITLGGALPTISVNNTSDTISSVLTGTAGLVKAGTGTLVLTGINTYTGATNISAGTLALSGSGALSTSTAISATASGATFDINAINASGVIVGSIAGVSGSSIVLGAKNLNAGGDNTSTTFDGVISGSGGSLTKSGSGTLVLTGTNTYTGGTTIAGGNLTISSDANLGGASGGITFANSSTLQINSSIASSNRLMTLGSGTNTIILGGGVNYSNSGKVTGSGNLVFNQTGSGTRTVTLSNTGNDFYGSLGIDLTGTAQLINLNIASLTDGVGAGNLRFGTGSVTPTFNYTGATPLSLSGRSIEFFDIGTGGVILTSTTAGININTNLVVSGSGSKTLTLDAPTSISSTFGGVIGNGSGTVAVSKTGAGTWTLSGANTFTGGTTVSAGTLALSGNGSLSASAVNVSGSTAIFDISGIAPSSTTVASIAGASGSSIALGAKTLIAGGDNTSTTFAGALTGAGGGLTKSGSGTLTLTGVNTHTGTTNIAAGKVALSGSGALTSSAINTSGSSSIFDVSAVTASSTTVASIAGVSGSSIVLGAKALSAGGDNTDTTFAGVISGTGAFTKTGTGRLILSGANTYSGVTTLSGGTVRLGNQLAAQNSTVTMNGGGAALEFDSAVAGNAFTVGGLAAASAGAGYDIALQNTSNAAIALTVGGNNTATTYAGVMSGGGSLIKTGTNTLTLSGANTFTGGVTLSAGTLITTADNNLGNGGGITVNGTATWNLSTGTLVTYARNVAINNGAVLTVTSGNATKTITGVLSGNGQIINSATTTFDFTNTSNTFTGIVNNGYETKFASLGDSSNAVNLIGSNSVFTWTGGAMTFAQRPFTLQATGTGTIQNSGTGGLVINQNLAISGTAGARTLTLSGVYTGSGNRFAGNIADGVGSTVSLNVLGTSNSWALSGTNTYSGTTTVGAGSGNGPTLIIQGSQALSPNTTVKLVSNSTPSGRLKLLDDTGGVNSSTLILPNTVSQDSANSTINFQIFVGNNNVTNGGTSSGTTTGSTISINKLSADTATMNNSKVIYGINAEGANSYTLGINNVEIPAFLAAAYTAATSWKWQLAANTAPISITGTVQQVAGSTSTTLTAQSLDLTGTNTGSIVSGSIKDSLDATPRPLSVTKLGAGTWTLSGNNTFSGGVTLSGATVGSRLNINSATALGTGTFTISGGNNASFDNTSGAAITLSTNNAQNWSNDFAFVGSNNLDLGTGSVTLGGNRSLTIGGTLTVGGAIGGAANIGIIKGGGGTLVLSGASTFTGTTTLNQGVLAFNTIADVSGGNSALGAPTTVPNGTIALGNTTLAATLRYTGTGSTSNRVINLLSTTGPVAIDQSGTGLLKFTSAFTATGAGSKTLTLTGSSAGTGEVGGAIVDNSGTNKTSLAKTGTGAWTLSAVNTFTGSTTVSGGKLTIASTGTINTTSGVTISGGELNYNSSTALSKAITFSGTGGKLSGTGTITPSVSVTSGNTLSPGNSIGTLTLSGGLILTGAYSVETAFTSATTASADKTVVVGTVNLTGSSLNVTELGSYFGLTSAAPIVIIQNDGSDAVTGTFASIVGNPPIAFTVLYNFNGDGGSVGNDVALSFTAVPEPTGIALFGLGGLGLLARRRRRVPAKAIG